MVCFAAAVNSTPLDVGCAKSKVFGFECVGLTLRRIPIGPNFIASVDARFILCELSQGFRRGSACMKRIAGLVALVVVMFCGPEIHAQSLQTAQASFAWVNCLSGAVGNMPNFGFDTNGNCYAVCHFH